MSIYIGIDPGTHTGVGVWDSRRRAFLEVKTLMLHQALELVKRYKDTGENVWVIFEDARLRKWYGKKSSDKIQGAGSIKRDCNIWEEFCTEKDIPFHTLAPSKGMTKMNEDYFKRLTGWTGRTSNHARDACLLVFGK